MSNAQWLWRRLILGLLLGVLGASTAACANPDHASPQIGADSPAAAAAGFFRTLNAALQDPTLDTFDTRRSYAERMAAYFPPSERMTYRQTLQEMLAAFAAGKANIPADQELSLVLEYDDLDVQQLSERQATVRLVGGSLRYRIIRTTETGFREVLFDRQYTLATVLGLESGDLPAVQFEGRWYLSAKPVS